MPMVTCVVEWTVVLCSSWDFVKGNVYFLGGCECRNAPAESDFTACILTGSKRQVAISISGSFSSLKG